MVVMEDVTEEERSAELYVSVHGSLDHTFLKRGGGGVIPFSDKISKVVFDVAKCFWFVCFGVCYLAVVLLANVFFGGWEMSEFGGGKSEFWGW